MWGQMKLLVFLVVFGLLSLAPRAALAWNEAGHSAIAMIAWRQLDERQRGQVGELLKHHPHYEKFLTREKPDGVDVNEWAFLRAAIWSDWVRPSRPGTPGETFKGPEITSFHRGDWHYVDK